MFPSSNYSAKATIKAKQSILGFTLLTRHAIDDIVFRFQISAAKSRKNRKDVENNLKDQRDAGTQWTHHRRINLNRFRKVD
jgi:Holliday junction resolvase RusA-like endonuclease